jgi:uncharacterized protein (DUF2336 family)
MVSNLPGSPGEMSMQDAVVQSARSSLIEELEHALTTGSRQQRAETLRRITDLFIVSAHDLNEQVTQIFDDVMGMLIEAIETKVRAELSERLAPISNAPSNVIRRLARDDEIAVAGPVLAQSARLTPTDLVDIAETKSQAHLLAISGRDVIEPVVTDVLVHRGDESVVRTVVANPGASFSDDGFGILVRRANEDDGVSERLARRTDIPPHLFCSLLVQATEAVRKRLLAVAPPDVKADVDRVVRRVSEELAAGSSAGIRRDYASAIHRCLIDHQVGRLGEPEVAAFAQTRQFEDAVAALSLLSGVSVDVIERAINSDRLEPTLILCRAAGLSFATTRTVLMLRPKNQSRLSEDISEAETDFKKLAVATARKITQFWLTRTSVH